MRLGSAFSQLVRAEPAPRPGIAHRAILRCESLESREMPAANLMGVNLSGVEDWSYDRMFADAMKSARRPSALGSHEGTPPIDAKGWPATDASIVLWHGIDNMHGTYRLSFTGQADVSTYWGAATVSNKQYNPATNTTTATITYHGTDKAGLLLNLASTRRTPAHALNSGVTDIRLMRPIAPGSTVSYDPGVTFTQPLKDLVKKFSVVRMMDNTGSNGGLELNDNWDARRPADYASQAAVGAARGMAWEYAIQFWNETGTDAWVNIPFPANDQYIQQLAVLLKANLLPGRKIYVEFSNELWNSWGPFPAVANRDAAVAEVRANPNSPLNYDGVYPARDPDGWELARRRIALRTVQVSNIFRQVFGDDQMMTRVRPVLMSQLGWTAGWLAGQLDYMEDYFNSPVYQPTPRPPSYYLYGAGGSAYQEPNWSAGNGITVNQIFDTMPHGFAQYLQSDLDWVAAFGLQRIAYEGGPSLDNLTANHGVPASTLEAAWNDPRMRTEIVANHHTWTANGGDLFMYFASTGDYKWGLTYDPFNLDTQKLRAIDDLNAAQAVPVTYGKAGPVDLTAGDFRIPYNQGTIAGMRADSLTQQWNGAVFRVEAAGNFAVRLTATASSGGRAEVFVGGRSIGLIDVPSSGESATLAMGSLPPGEHGIIVRARSGTFSLSRVSVLTAGAVLPAPEPPPPARPNAPTGLMASPAGGPAIALAWTDNAFDETWFLIERATDPYFNVGRTAFSAGGNATSFTDTTVAPGGTYYYRVCAMNGTLGSANSNTASATAPVGTGLAVAFFDNPDLTGHTVSRLDPVIDFYWPASPTAGIAPDTYSARWLGQVQAIESGNYVFRTFSDDGVRLWVDGKLVVNNWTQHAGTYNTSAAISLKAGTRYDIRVEYFNQYGGGVLKLEWRRPGQSAYAVIPTAQFTPASGGTPVFMDGFDAGLGQWTPTAGTWKAASTSRGQVFASTGSVPERLALAGNPSWTDYSVSAWVNLSSLNGGLSLLGRVVDATHYYQLEIRKGANGKPAWVLSKRDGNVVTTLATGALTYSAGAWVQLRLTMVGSDLRAEFSTNGSTYTVLGSATDGQYTAGRVGLRSWTSTAYFDDVVVRTA